MCARNESDERIEPTGREQVWRTVLRRAVRRPQDLPSAVFSESVESMKQVCEHYPMLIPEGYLNLALSGSRQADSESWSGNESLVEQPALLRMVVPDSSEFSPDPCGQQDPLAEEAHSPVFGLIHRYPDRALLLVTTLCASYCRFCTRKRLAGRGWSVLTDEQLQAVCDYLTGHPGVREVLLSGGDPLVLSDERLESVLAAIRRVESVKVIRLGTRVPAVLPERITSETAAMLARYGPLYVVTHFNHPAELDPAASQALALLADAGLPLANQTVLMAGVNDDIGVLIELGSKLQENRVRPYYLHLMDRTLGTAHFRVPVGRALELAEGLRRRVGGLAVPLLMVDLPGGGGKVPLAEHLMGRDEDGNWLVRDAQGEVVTLADC